MYIRHVYETDRVTDYPMDWHGMALNFTPMAAYYIKCCVPDCEILEAFHPRIEYES